jgi:hypothetical protein
VVSGVELDAEIAPSELDNNRAHSNTRFLFRRRVEAHKHVVALLYYFCVMDRGFEPVQEGHKGFGLMLTLIPLPPSPCN